MDPLDVQWIHSDGFSESSRFSGSSESIQMDPMDTMDPASGSICEKQHLLNWMFHLMDPMDPSEWIQWMSNGAIGSTRWIHLQILNGSSGSI